MTAIDVDLELPCRIEPIAELTAHEERVWQVSWNPTKPLLASCSSDKDIRIWSYRQTTSHPDPDLDAQARPEIKFGSFSLIPSGHTKSVRCLAWSPSGQTLAAGSFDSCVSTWVRESEDLEDAGSSAEWECTSMLEGHESECKGVAYSASGQYLASCSRDKSVWIWEALPDNDYECITVQLEHSQDVKCVAWNPTEDILASASYDDTIRLYLDDPDDDWYCSTVLKGHHTSTIWSLAWSPDGRYLASASDDKTVRIWKRQGHTGADMKPVLILEGHTRSVFSVSWSSVSGKEGSLGRMASTGGDGTIRIWELFEPQDVDGNPSSLQSKLIAELRDAHGVHDVNHISFCPREAFSDLLATAGDDCSIKIWRIESRTA